jgi:signal transduction histidine kinase
VILDDFGLDSGLRWLCERFLQRTRIPVEYTSNFSARLDESLETHLFRIAQEALSNALRHARAQEIHVCLEFDATGLGLRIRDDGVGFAAEEALERSRRLNSLGLLGMRERVATVGGRFRIESRPGAGTEVATLFYAPPNLQ